jgi:hypothetical protein
MSLSTPDVIRTLQRKLYGKAKVEPDYRFYLLYDKVWRADILAHAYDLARANDGAPGVDRETFERIEAAGRADWLARLGEELRTKTYRCQPVRRVMIPKPGGGERPLGIPTIRDRVVQTAAKLVLEPIFEADLDPAAFGYRPQRSATEAIEAVLALLKQGHTDVVDADLSKYFDTIPHDELMQSVAQRVVDKAPSAGRNDRPGWQAAHGRWPDQAARHTTRWRAQPVVGQYLHEPLSEILAPDRPGRGLAGARHQLRRRLRHPQPRPRGRGTGVDRADDDAPGAQSQPHQNTAVQRTVRAVRLPRLQLRAAPLSADRPGVYRGQSVEEERAASAGQGACDPDAGQHGQLG